LSYNPTRRHFLISGAIAGAALATPKILRAQTTPSAAQKLNVACIGVGGRGHSDLTEVAKCAGVNIVALCDVEGKNLDKAAETFPGAKKHVDFRKMLESQNDIDAVTVATPDHTHFSAAMLAITLGKHVYCEKPMTYTIEETRRLTHAARKYKVATQMGTQHHSSEGHHQQAEVLQSGLVGDVREVHIWTNRPIWPQGINRPAEQPVPDSLNWDLWLGPAPQRPYNEAYAPFKWRGWKDFGTGALGDMGCHLFDTTHWGLNLRRRNRIPRGRL
jgi:predicted dehydrogenase